jgi:hypothetical protein
MEHISRRTLETLETKIQANQLSAFIHHFKSLIIQNDKAGCTFSVSNFLSTQESMHPTFFSNFTKEVERLIQPNEIVLKFIFGVCHPIGVGIEKDLTKAFSILQN